MSFQGRRITSELKRDLGIVPPPPLPPPPRLLGGRQWNKLEYAVGGWILRQFRRIGAKRRQRQEQSAKRQAALDQFWKSEQIRLRPNMAYLLSWASFEKVMDWDLQQQLFAFGKAATAAGMAAKEAHELMKEAGYRHSLHNGAIMPPFLGMRQQPMIYR